MELHKRVELADGIQLETDCRDNVTEVTSTQRAINKFWTWLPNFNVCKMDVSAEHTRPRKAWNSLDVRGVNADSYFAVLKLKRIREEGNIPKDTDEYQEPAQPEWASLILIDINSDGLLLFFIDSWTLNAMNVKELYKTPRMDECVDSSGEAPASSTLDANSGYWQFGIYHCNNDKKKFARYNGL